MGVFALEWGMAKKRAPIEIPIPLDRAEQPCPLCSRKLGSEHVDEHHLVPKSEGGREKFPIHRVCHTKIHSAFTERELALGYHDWEALKGHPEMAKFIAWIAKKPPHFIDRNRRSSAKGPR